MTVVEQLLQMGSQLDRHARPSLIVGVHDDPIVLKYKNHKYHTDQTFNPSVIHHHTGNLLDSPDNIIAHGCNTLGLMGAGIAAQIKYYNSELFEAYVEFCEMQGIEGGLGQIFIYPTDDKSKLVINCMTQPCLRSRTVPVPFRYHAFVQAWQSVINFLCQHDVPSISISRIGCSHGGGNFEIVKYIIGKMTPDHITVNIYHIDQSGVFARGNHNPNR